MRPRPLASCRTGGKRRPHRTAAWLMFFLPLLMLCACQPDLKAYKPQSMAEAEIRVLLLDVQSAWNRKDQAAFAALLHRHATFWLQREKRIVDRKTYLKNWAREVPAKVHFERPVIKFRGNKAFVDLDVKSAKGIRKTTFTLLKQDHRWWILAIR